MKKIIKILTSDAIISIAFVSALLSLIFFQCSCTGNQHIEWDRENIQELEAYGEYYNKVECLLDSLNINDDTVDPDFSFDENNTTYTLEEKIELREATAVSRAYNKYLKAKHVLDSIHYGRLERNPNYKSVQHQLDGLNIV